jgi:hypothetical protein
MDLNEIVDSLSHEFLLVRMKRELDQIHDPETLRHMVLQVIEIVEGQKAIFKKLMRELIDDDPEAQRMFE